MITIIKKGTSKAEVNMILQNIEAKPKKTLKKFFGVLSIEGDAIEIQKKLRNEWK